MNQQNDLAFKSLFNKACEKCFGHPVTTPLTETESKVLSNAILDQTGLVIGVKSIKNYSLYVLSNKEGKKENPSIATLDTLARYVLNAPYSDEGTRKERESHYPYWFQFKSSHGFKSGKRVSYQVIVIAITLMVIFALIGIFLLNNHSSDREANILDDFTSVSSDTLSSNGWQLQNLDENWWSKRSETPGYLSLYTLIGDNWPEGGSQPIRNLLVREINGNCFTTEMHLEKFFPNQNWQQAGLLLSENKSFTGKVLRISISYNNFFGGFDKSPEIIIQGLSSIGGGSKPEEFAHTVIFNVDSSNLLLAEKNLQKLALRIEKNGSQFRFLFSTGEVDSFAFREAVSREFDIEPQYLALFAIQGLTTDEHPLEVKVDSFTFQEMKCRDNGL